MWVKLLKDEYVSFIPELFTGNIGKDSGTVYFSVAPIEIEDEAPR